jgi:Pyridoxamine 5'-phosphate oxidase
MSKAVGDALPDDLFARLSGGDLPAVADRAVIVCSVDDRGFPHPALLSYFEVLAIDPRTIRLAMYSDSRTTRNARREGRLTLVFVDAGAAYYVKGTVKELSGSMRATPYNAKLDFRVAEVLADAPNPDLEPGAYISGGITYVNPGRDQELERARGVLSELRA